MGGKCLAGHIAGGREVKVASAGGEGDVARAVLAVREISFLRAAMTNVAAGDLLAVRADFWEALSSSRPVLARLPSPLRPAAKIDGVSPLIWLLAPLAASVALLPAAISALRPVLLMLPCVVRDRSGSGRKWCRCWQFRRWRRWRHGWSP